MNTPSLFLVAIVMAFWLCFINREGGIGLGLRFMWVLVFASQFFAGPITYYFAGLPPSEADPIERNQAVRLAVLGLGAFLIASYKVVPGWVRSKFRKWTTSMIHADVSPKRPVWQMGPRRLKEHFAEAERKLIWGEFGSLENQNYRYRIAIILMAIGFLSQLGNPIFYKIATVRAVWSNITLLVEVGATMFFIYGFIKSDRRSMLTAIAIVLFSGAVRAATAGFFGSTLQELVFLFAVYLFRERIQWRNWLVFLGIGILALVPYFAWLSARGALRESISRGDTFAEKRHIFLREVRIPSVHELFTPSGVEKIQMRLDMSGLLAHAIEYTPAYEPFANGKTIFPAVFVALIPRDLYEWAAKKEKPKVGDTEIVSKYTGLIFAQGTSVGLPVIFEFYVNYGYWGVVGGCFLMGLGCGYIDMLYRFLGARKNWLEYTGLLLLWPLTISNTALYQMSMTVPVCLFVCYILHRFILPVLIKKPRLGVIPIRPNISPNYPR